MNKEDVIEILERFVIGAKPCSQREIVDACASAYRMLKEQPSLPSNLDEAAEEYKQDEIDTSVDYHDVTGEPLCFMEALKDAFKAGAEWMAGQGVTKEAVIGMATEEISINVSQEALDDLDVFPGDKVVVQIRKK